MTFHFSLFKKHKIKQVKNELRTIRQDINFLKEYVLIKESCPEILDLLRKRINVDISRTGLNWTNNELKSQPMYALFSEEFYYKITSIKLLELSPVHLRDAEDRTFEILEYMKFLSKDKLNECYYILLHKLREVFMIFQGLPNKIFEQLEVDLKDDYSCPYNHLFSLSYSLMKDDENLAFEKIKNYISHCGINKLHLFIPVAYYARSLGYTNKKIEKSALMFERLKETSKNGEFIKRIKENKVAICGNGPQEINTNNGGLIDSYDEVIRFNEFNQFISSFASGYGKKTTMCAETNDYPDKHISNTQFRILRRNCYVQEIYNYDDYSKLMDNKHSFYCIDDEIYKEIYDNYGLISPTTGFLLLYLVKKIKKEAFTINDVFGFSFKNFDDDGSSHYNREKTLNGHDMDAEMKVLSTIFNKEKGK